MTEEQYAKHVRLSRYSELKKDLGRISNSLLAARDRSTNVSPNMSGMPSSHGAKDNAQNVIEIIDMEREWKKAKETVFSEYQFLLDCINTLEDQTERTFVWDYYVFDMSIVETANEINYSDRSVYRIRDSALDNIIIKDGG